MGWGRVGGWLASHDSPKRLQAEKRVYHHCSGGGRRRRGREDRLSIFKSLTSPPARAAAVVQRTEIMEKGAKGEEKEWNLGVRRALSSPYTELS